MLSSSLRAMVATLSSKQVKLDELESATQHDPLTGLLNRAGLQSWLSRAVAQARTEPSGLLVLVGDLDGFKQVNDTQGHAAGDNLLQRGGATAAILGPHPGRRGADRRGRIRGGAARPVGPRRPIGAGYGPASVVTRDGVLCHWGRTISIGLSLGGAGWPEDDRQLDLVLNKADAALYAAKRAGKGRIVFHREPALG